MKTLSISDLSIDYSVEGGNPLGCVNIAGTMFHAMLIEVEGPNSPVAVGEGQDMIDGIANADYGARYQTVEHEGKHYFLVIHPFQA